MTGVLRLTRRAYLRALSALVALGLAPGLARAARAPSGRDDLLALVRRRDSAVRIGRAFLERHPEESDAAQLVAALPPASRRRLRARIRADFLRGDTVQIEGWLLSRTEARLCALAALTGD